MSHLSNTCVSLFVLLLIFFFVCSWFAFDICHNANYPSNHFLVVRSQTLVVVACNLRKKLVFISVLNWPRGSHSLIAPRGIVLVALYTG